MRRLLGDRARHRRAEPAGDSCAVARPDFGAAATAADRNLFAYDVNAPLNLQKAVESTNNGVEVSAISFSSPDGGSVTGLLFDPVTRSSLRPGIVLMHGMPGNARSMAAYAQLLAEHGAVVIAIDAPFARRGGQPVRFSAQDRAEQIQLIKDLQRAVDVLRARPNVDDERIAYLGISYGGAMGALFVGIERRIKAAVLVVGDGGLVSHFTGPEDFELHGRSVLCDTCRLVPGHGTHRADSIHCARVAHRVVAAKRTVRTTWYPWPMRRSCTQPRRQPKTIRWYDAGHGLNQQAVFDRHDWLHGQIGLDARQ